VPFIALLHAQGGFSSVLAAAAMFGAAIVAAALAFWITAQQRLPSTQAAE
jgi:hypothetical protein